MKKTLVFVLALVGVIYFLGWHLQPFEPRFFSFHDDTQVGRIKEFSYALQNLQIPPRMAPHFSFGMGFPVFNFYAPFSYWVGSLLHITGVPIVMAAKLSLFLALITAFIGMFLYISRIFSFIPALVASTVYVSSTWIATEIFARGNIGEVWFIALLPLVLFLLEVNGQKKSPFVFILTTLTISWLITSHNVLSLVGIPLLICYILLSKKTIKINSLSLGFALLLAAYFFLPLITETSLTYAKAQAERTPYQDHFVCIQQIWSSPTWELGGSGAGCNDGMSFKLGKLHLILGSVGLFIFLLITVFTKKKSQITYKLGFIAVFGIGALFLMLEYSRPIWDLFQFVLAPFQFPWRFNTFFLFTISVFTGFAFYYASIKINRNLVAILSLLTVALLLFTARPYFRHPWRMTFDEYYHRYVSDSYIYSKIAYAIPEYLPRTADYDKWMGYRYQFLHAVDTSEYKPFLISDSEADIKYDTYTKTITTTKNDVVTVNIHYFPYWRLTLNATKLIPSKFDELGRPIIKLRKGDILTIEFRQTPVQQVGNTVTLISLLGLLLISINTRIWKKLKSISN